MASNRTARWKKSVAAAALVVTGAGVGATLAGTNVASAASTASSSVASAASTASSSVASAASSAVDQSKSQRSDEHLLTGTTADKVRAAALAKYPGATVQRVETDSDGVYEAHVVTADGTPTIVQVGSDFTVTGTQQGGPGGAGGQAPSGTGSGA